MHSRRNNRRRASLLIGLALAITAMSAVSASGAQALSWYTSTTETGGSLLAGSESATTKLTEAKNLFQYGPDKGKGGVKFQISWLVGAGKTPVVMQATGVECVGCSIENSPTAKGFGKLKLSNLTLLEPASCKLSSSELTTNSLRWEPFVSGGKQYVKFISQSGPDFSFSLTGTGCSLAGTYAISGYIVAESSGDLLSKSSRTHQLDFSPAIQKVIPESEGAHWVATSPVYFEGSTRNALSSNKFWFAS